MDRGNCDGGGTRGTKACAYDGTNSSENVYGDDYRWGSRGVPTVDGGPRVMLPNRYKAERVGKREWVAEEGVGGRGCRKKGG